MMATIGPLKRVSNLVRTGEIAAIQCGRPGFVSIDAVAVVATASEDAMREYVESSNDGYDAIHFSLRCFRRYVSTGPIRRHVT